MFSSPCYILGPLSTMRPPAATISVLKPWLPAGPPSTPLISGGAPPFTMQLPRTWTGGGGWWGGKIVGYTDSIHTISL